MVCVATVQKPGIRISYGHIFAESIINFCKEKFARFKAPKSVEFGELPKTATGKIKKFQLREKEWQGKERKVK